MSPEHQPRGQSRSERRENSQVLTPSNSHPAVWGGASGSLHLKPMLQVVFKQVFFGGSILQNIAINYRHMDI